MLFENYKYWRLFVFATILLLAFSCSKDEEIIEEPPVEEEPVENSKTFIYDHFKQNYLWFEELPDVDPNSYSTNKDLVDTLRYEEVDHWSYVANLQEHRALFENAETKGFGAGMSYVIDGEGIERFMRLFVRFTYKNAPMGLAGVDRGWEILQVGNLVVKDVDITVDIDNINKINNAFDTDNELNLTFVTTENDTVVRSMARTIYQINTVLHKSVQAAGGRKVGYLVFESFLGDPSIQALDDAFDYFVSENIEDLIIDLRYNTGGFESTAFHLMAKAGGSDVLNENILAAHIYNSKRSSDNRGYYLGNEYVAGNYVNFDRLFFITTDLSASASEMVINSLFPYKEVILIGDRTHGKPVGMEPYDSEEYNIALRPITFQIVNAHGNGHYFNGIPVDYAVNDDIFRAWGDPEEACLKKALQVISGEGGEVAMKSARVKPIPVPLKRGLQEITGAY